MLSMQESEIEKNLTVASLTVFLREMEGYTRGYREDLWNLLAEYSLAKHRERIQTVKLLLGVNAPPPVPWYMKLKDFPAEPEPEVTD